MTAPSATVTTPQRASGEIKTTRNRVVLALAREQDHHLDPFRRRLSLPVITDDLWDPCILDRHDVALLVVLSNDIWDLDRCLRAARQKGIPSLLLMDGILEFKHQWTNPRSAAGGGAPFLTPVLADKIACKGWNDMRRLESWGNQGQCELVGLPRLDPYQPPRRYRRRTSSRKRVLVASANTPWFTGQQRRNAVHAFSELRDFARTRRDIQFIWRLRRWVRDVIELSPEPCSDSEMPLSEVLHQVDSVITQPSTVQLEAMLCGLPVAVLDFDNVPAFLPSAWRITAPSQISPTIRALLKPEPARLSYQDECLHSELYCPSPAADRLVALMEEMISIGERAKPKGVPLQFPHQILPADRTMSLSVHLDLAQQYPQHPTFGNRQILDMQRRLAMAEQELKVCRHKLNRRSLGYWIERTFHSIGRRLASRSRK